jgi:hypothetical protein
MAYVDEGAATAEHVRTLPVFELGVGYDRTAWFVYHRLRGNTVWLKHCGPYSTREQAADWINAIRVEGAE